MRKEKALKILNELTEKANFLLKNNPLVENEIEEWNGEVFKAISYIFPNGSEYIVDFIIAGKNTVSLEDDNLLENDNYILKNKIIKKKEIILKMIKEIQDFWEDENIVLLAKQLIEQPTLSQTIKEKSKDIFIVHGHDDGLVIKVQLFLTKIGLNGIVLHEQANLGKVILEKLEHYTNVDFAIVLYTPCDLGKAKDGEELRARARQNVVFEHGYLIGRLGRRNVAFLIDGKIETPGDISGAVYSSVSNHWQFEILKELKAVGYDVDANNLC